MFDFGLLLITSVLVLATPLIVRGVPRVYREFQMMWRFEPLPAAIVHSEIESAALGYRVKLRYVVEGVDLPDDRLLLGPDVGLYSPTKMGAQALLERLKKGRMWAYVDRKRNRAFLSERKYGYIDKLLAPCLVIVLPFAAPLVILFSAIGLLRLFGMQ